MNSNYSACTRSQSLDSFLEACGSHDFVWLWIWHKGFWHLCCYRRVRWEWTGALNISIWLFQYWNVLELLMLFNEVVSNALSFFFFWISFWGSKKESTVLLVNWFKSFKMEIRMDFLDWLDHDTSMKILRCLEDPADLVRVSSVSRSWRHFGEYLVLFCLD